MALHPRGRRTRAVRPRLLVLEDRALPSTTPLDPGDFYWADGKTVPLARRNTQYAIGLTPGTTLDALTNGPLAGFHVVNALSATTALVEADAGPRTDGDLWAVADSTAWPRRDGIAWAAPVFENPTNGGWVVATDEVVVRLQPGVSADAFFANDARFLDYRPLRGTPDQFIATTAGRGRATLDLANTLMSDSRLMWASPNLMLSSRFHSLDPLYAQSWHLNNTGQSGGTADADVDAPEAWAITTGNSNIVIADIDDAIQRDHPDLIGNVWANPGEVAGNGIDDDGNGYIDDNRGWDFWDNDNDPTPNAGSTDNHGTATAGVAVAVGDNNLGSAGVAYGARLMPIRSNIVPALSPADVPTAVYYAAGRTANGLGTWRGADILTCSWGFDAPYQPLNDAFAWASANGRGGRGIAMFVASGNSGAASVGYPANLAGSISGVIAVGGSGHNDTRVSYSQYGPELDFVAPTSPAGITTTDRTGSAGYNSTSDYTASFSGTSSATPLAAGVGALALGQNPNLTAVQLRALLRNTSNPIGTTAYDPVTGKNLPYGFGRVNAFAAVSGVGKAEIQLLDDRTNVADGATLDFNRSVGGFLDKTFRIRNQGTLDLTLGTLSLPAGPFTILTNVTDSVLSVGEATTFTVRYTPVPGPVQSRVLSFTTNDSDETLFDITLRGSGGLFLGATATTVGTGPVDSVAADFNADGRMDLAVANNGSGTVSVLLRNTTGGFQAATTYTTGTGTYGLAVGNFNGDSAPDLVVTSFVSATATAPRLLTNANNGTGTFTVSTLAFTVTEARDVVSADFNGDTRADLAIVSQSAALVRIYFGTGTGTFTAGSTNATGTTPRWVRVGDLNNDTRADLVVSNTGAGTVSVFLGNVGGTFTAQTAVTMAAGTDQPALVDLNEDGFVDVATANTTAKTVTFAYGVGNGTFQSAQSIALPALTPTGLATADFDRDGHADLAVVSNATSGSVTALLGNGNGTFRPDGPYAAAISSAYTTVADFNADGAPDVVTTNGGTGTTVNLLLNQAPAPPRVGGVQVNAGAVQRSRVTTLTVTFNAQVTFAGTVAAAFNVARVNGGSVGGFSASSATVGGVTVVTLTAFTGAETEFGSLADGYFAVRVLASQVSVNGVPLDGNANGIGGDDYLLTGTLANGLFRLFGDGNGDGSVSGSDFGAFRLAFGTTTGDPAYVVAFDFDANGSIAGSDFGNFRIRFGTSLP